jgi:hypothetical protein
MQLVEIEMGPSKVIRTLYGSDAGQTVPRAILGIPSGRDVHRDFGFLSTKEIKRKKYFLGLGIILISVGIPDAIDHREKLIIEMKSVSSKLEIDYQIKIAILQASFYCWMLGFTKFAVWIVNAETGLIEVIVREDFNPHRFLKKLKMALRLVIEEKSTVKTLTRREKKRKEYYWLMRTFVPSDQS